MVALPLVLALTAAGIAAKTVSIAGGVASLVNGMVQVSNPSNPVMPDYTGLVENQ